MDLKRSSLRGLFSLWATMAISMAASLSGTLKSFTSPAVPGAAAARTGFGAGAAAALLLDKAEMKTVPIMIAQLRAADYSKFDLGKVYMFILLAILPVLLVYIFLSRYIVKGVTAGSVKG